MPPMAVPVNGSVLNPTLLSPPPAKLSVCSSTAVLRRVWPGRSRNGKSLKVPPLAKPSKHRVSSLQEGDGEVLETVNTEDALDELDRVEITNLKIKKERPDKGGSSLLVTLAVALGLAAIFTAVSISLEKNTLGSSLGFKILAEDSISPLAASTPVGFSFKAFGYKVLLPDYAPGWVYFWLLMAAGFGLFISEEALNIWVGITLSRMLSLDGTWQSFVQSLSKNTPYILSTVLWVYWGVCISDMVPFYLGKLFRQSGASDDVCSKLGVGKDKAVNITRAVQRYGNLIGFVERFSLGVRNPTAFLAGALGISPEYFFAGVCCGGLVTLPLQLGIGFLLRERPLFALATVATVMGIWTIFPYAIAALTALFLFLRRRYST